MARPPKDGMFTRFNGPVMDQLVTLVPDFQTRQEADDFYRRMWRRKHFKTLTEIHLENELPPGIQFDRGGYRCTFYASRHSAFGGMYLQLRPGRRNPMEIIHIVAHYLQPSDSRWHAGEFGSIFLDLVGMMFGPDIKRAAKDVLIENKIRTAVRSEDARARQSDAYFKRKAEAVPEKLLRLLKEAENLG